MQRTAYINKNNEVVYIAAFAEDKIQKAGGKLLFGGSEYLPEEKRWVHKLGQDAGAKAEEVFAVDGSSLSVGDTYTPPPPEEPAVEDKKALALAEKRKSLDELRTQIMIEKANEEEGWEERAAKLKTLRDALIIEIEALQ